LPLRDGIFGSPRSAAGHFRHPAADHRSASSGQRAIDVVDTGPGAGDEIHRRVIGGRVACANSKRAPQLGLGIVQPVVKQLDCMRGHRVGQFGAI